MKPLMFFALLICIATGCSRPYCDYAIVGADEFVTDSYKIREGKFGILEMEGIETGCIPPEAMEEYQDAIAEDDVLNVVVYHPKRKDLMESFQFINDKVGGFRVYQGRLELPDIESVYVEGLTLEEARMEVQARLSEHIQDAEVFIGYKDRLLRKVELAGLVKVPAVPVDGKIRLFEVLSKASPPPQANLYMSYVLRNGMPMAVDMYKLMNTGDMSQNIVMRGGDKIFIASPSDATVMLMGEVGLPTAVSLPYGFMSLREALVAARGIPYTGDRRRIQVIRGNIPCPKIYVLSWEHIIHLPNNSLLLMPGDTVYVSEKPITAWNRFINQLLPSFQGVQAAYGVYRLTTD
ncbi:MULTISPECIES: polysaccharide biosynthesis/export family protein [Parachlamydia]|uniref:Putative polysaccharide export protein wza n=2 Tax=Parachlamydia acanthamoebae TaxID=83552 RepID=F8KVN6_PARAV|nr:polysaccharide biosynthesis/export family protein [Parachlamydia acanthamoebae]EFB42211.1 hypothetical protein pah_c014o150 [Parachlamydia acanthamoebae str. Hall's coccus]KIA76375.1 putative polysaccharide export protein wza [Parachlamydia acanthamoebae]CCB85172.1 putative polysaccharide export protein wza [Parachlamydia acanthamoebae UV-7]